MCKRNKACIYMFIVVMVLQIIIPALSVILETSYTLTSEAACAWDIGAEGSKITATLYNTTLQINGTGKIKDNIKWIKNGKDYRRYFFNIIINKGIDDIGIKAFRGCENLKSVQASYVKNIGEEAFGRMCKARNNYYE